MGFILVSVFLTYKIECPFGNFRLSFRDDNIFMYVAAQLAQTLITLHIMT